MKKIIICTVAVLSLIFFLYFFKGTSEESGCELYNQTQLLWVPEFNKYFAENDMQAKVDNLKQGLDDISVAYIDKYMDNSKYWNVCTNTIPGYDRNDRVSDYDIKLYKEFKNIPFENPYSSTVDVHVFMYKNLYGMKDLPKEVLEKINGKAIIDVGAYTGDTAYMFYKYFPKSDIYAYEPVKAFYDVIPRLVEEINKKESQKVLIHPFNKGLGSKEDIQDIEYQGRTSKVKITTIDNESQKLKLKNIGLIKADVEGFESDVLAGAKEVIAKQKPVLVFAIYHNPEDFFELKDKIKAINPDYKFMIRRSEDILADADLVLIAY